jgi:hypothetical protein
LGDVLSDLDITVPGGTVVLARIPDGNSNKKKVVEGKSFISTEGFIPVGAKS